MKDNTFQKNKLTKLQDPNASAAGHCKHTKNIHTTTSIGTQTHARTHMRAKIYTNTNSVTHIDTHQISGATGSKATNSRNLIEAGRNQRMS